MMGGQAMPPFQRQRGDQTRQGHDELELRTISKRASAVPGGISNGAQHR
jgi:hypothetical protein